MILLPTILSVRSVDLPSHLPLSFFKSSQNWRSGLTLVYQSKFIFLIVKSSFKYSQSEKCINNSLFPDLIEIKHLCSEKRENNCSLLCPTKSFFYTFSNWNKFLTCTYLQNLRLWWYYSARLQWCSYLQLNYKFYILYMVLLTNLIYFCEFIFVFQDATDDFDVIFWRFVYWFQVEEINFYNFR